MNKSNRGEKGLSFFRKLNILKDITDEDLIAFCEEFDEREFLSGEPIFHQYEPIDGVYFLDSICIVKSGDTIIKEVTGLIGVKYSYREEQYAQYTIIPKDSGTCLFMKIDLFPKILRSHPKIQGVILENLIIQIGTEINQLKLESDHNYEQRKLSLEILENLGQGSFSIDSSGEIGNNYTSFAAEYLGRKNLDGVPFADVILRKDRKGLKNYYRALNMLFSGDMFDPEVVVSLLPKEVCIEDRHLKLYYSFVEDKEGNVLSLFIRMEDISSLKKLETLELEVTKKEEIEKKILDKMRENIGGFLDLLENLVDTIDLLDGFKEECLLKNSLPDASRVVTLMRALHGSKGLSGQFELKEMKSLIHEMESCVSSISSSNIEEAISTFKDLYKQIKKEFRHVESFKTDLGPSIVSIIDGINFSQDEFNFLFDSIDRGKLEEAKSILSNKINLPANTLVQGWEAEIHKLSNQLDKKIEFNLETDKNLRLPKQIIKRLNNSLGHLYRNSIDHGIELPDIRKSIGKPEIGKITILIRQENNALIIEIGDDGKGIDENRIIKKAKENKKLDQAQVEQYLVQKDFFNILCMPGFSEKEGITEVSGRGIGMDAVQTSLENLNGKIQMYSEKDKYTKFRIKIPL